ASEAARSSSSNVMAVVRRRLGGRPRAPNLRVFIATHLLSANALGLETRPSQHGRPGPIEVESGWWDRAAPPVGAQRHRRDPLTGRVAQSLGEAVLKGLVGEEEGQGGLPRQVGVVRALRGVRDVDERLEREWPLRLVVECQEQANDRRAGVIVELVANGDG